MSFDLNTGLKRVNAAAGDAAAQALVQACLDTSWSLAETYCDRGLKLKVQKVKFKYPWKGNDLQLPRWPIIKIMSISSEVGSLPSYKVNYEHGNINFKGNFSTDVTVEFLGGYDPVPPTLELALWGIFDNVYSKMSGQGSPSSPSGIDKIVIQGVGSLSYSDSGSSDSSGSDNNLGGMLPDSSAAMLMFFKRYYC